jgi:hypothetical protein
MTSGCLKAAAAGFAVFVAVTLGAAFVLEPVSGESRAWIWASLVAGGCALAAVTALVQLPDARRELRTLREAARGVPPVDGSEAVISGTIRAAALLRAPFSGEPVAAYEYAVRQRRGINASTDDTYHFGSASAPLVLETARGPLPLLGYPALFSAEREIDRAVARPAFEAFAAETTFVRPESPSGPAQAVRDGTAEHRSDWKFWEGEPFWPRARFLENVLRDGETVTIRGVYRAGLGIAGDVSAGAPLALFPGDLESALRRSRARLRDILVGAVLFTLLAAATVAAGRIWLESQGGGGTEGQACNRVLGGTEGQACNRVLCSTIHECTPDPIGSDAIGRNPIGWGRAGGAPRGAFS